MKILRTRKTNIQERPSTWKVVWVESKTVKMGKNQRKVVKTLGEDRDMINLIDINIKVEYLLGRGLHKDRILIVGEGQSGEDPDLISQP